uniref:Protein kinase domain-containing protein n=1 Tax=Oryza punctata TaxID=4537 RepID=A0A0E0LY71_ORYPU
MRIKHSNIVQFVGYCAEMRVEVVREGLKNIFAESRAKLLCFEYLHNGSLRRYLTDLKPDNILLDDVMVPKIADFGLSRLLGEGKSRTVTRNKPGTFGYMAPEYLDDGAITTKSDIYSLGVIIREMVIGRHKMGAPTGNALESWKTRLQLDSSHMSQIPLEVGYQQVEACIEISRRCTDTNPDNRPATLEILHKLEETETVDIRSISKLMNDLKLMAVTFSRQPSTQVERYKVLSPVLSLSTPPTNKIRRMRGAARRQWGDITKGPNDPMQPTSRRLCGSTATGSSPPAVSVAYPVERDDGWMELKLAEFPNDESGERPYHEKWPHR